MANWITAIAAFIAAFATAGYFCYTVKIFRETKKSADSARISARAAGTSADAAADNALATSQLAKLTSELYRPYVGLQSSPLHISRIGEHEQWQITWTIRNFGTTAANHVQPFFEAWLDLIADHSTPDLKIENEPPSDAELFPGSEPITRKSTLSPTPDECRYIRSQVALCYVRATVNYTTPTGTTFTNTTLHQVDPTRFGIRLIESKTEPREPLERTAT